MAGAPPITADERCPMTDAEFDRLTADIELTRAELGRTVSELRRQAGPSAQARRIATRVQAWLRQHPRQEV